MSKIRVFLVDDNHIVCEGLRRMLEQEEDLCVVGEAQSGEDALSRLHDIPADVVLLARIHRRTPMDGVRKAEGGVRELQGK